MIVRIKACTVFAAVSGAKQVEKVRKSKYAPVSDEVSYPLKENSGSAQRLRWLMIFPHVEEIKHR